MFQIARLLGSSVDFTGLLIVLPLFGILILISSVLINNLRPLHLVFILYLLLVVRLTLTHVKFIPFGESIGIMAPVFRVTLKIYF